MGTRSNTARRKTIKVGLTLLVIVLAIWGYTRFEYWWNTRPAGIVGGWWCIERIYRIDPVSGSYVPVELPGRFKHVAINCSNSIRFQREGVFSVPTPSIHKAGNYQRTGSRIEFNPLPLSYPIQGHYTIDRSGRSLRLFSDSTEILMTKREFFKIW